MKKTVILSLMFLAAVPLYSQVQSMPPKQQQAQPQQAQQQAPKPQISPLSLYQSEKQTYEYKVKHKVAKKRRSATREGVRDLNKKNYSSAVKNFRSALKADSNYAKAQYNLAVAHSKLNQNDSALNRYQQVCRNSSSTPELRTKAHYNAGNLHLRQALASRDSGRYDGQNLKASIEHYKAALRLDSHNSDAQHNLSIAKQLLRPENQQGGGGGGQQQQNQDQQNQQNQQQDQNNQDKNNQQQNQQNQQQNQQNQQQQNDQQQNQSPQDKKEREQRRREAEQMLNAMKNNEQQTMKAVHRRESERENGRPAKIEKDW